MPVVEQYRARVASGALSEDPAQTAAAERLSELARALTGWRPGLKSYLFGRPGPGLRGLYLHGAVGRGKSMLMDLFFDEAPVAKKRRVHFHAFMEETHAAIAAARAERPGDPLPRVAKAIADRNWLLCFDELQITDIADAMIVGRLFTNLFERGVVVVTTSNRHPDDLYRDGLNRQLFTPFIDLIKHRLDLIELDAARDYRLERLARAPVWAAPLGPEASAAMDAHWRRLTAGQGERGEAIHVQGRTLRAPRTAAGAARFSFDDLCAQPLGAADYLALARAFHTVVVDDIPRLGPENRNEASRFVTLIDILYDTRTKLVASADAEPEELYPEGDGAFEFARTASRLHEMRSSDYLALAREGL